jgi:hypothetical protein
MAFVASDPVERSVFAAIFAALGEASQGVIGPANPCFPGILIHDGPDIVTGLWGVTLFRCLGVDCSSRTRCAAGALVQR